MSRDALAPQPVAEPLEPRLLLSADVDVLSSSMILPDLAATEVSLLPGGEESSEVPSADAPAGDDAGGEEN
ncbi:MAG: LEPR-XLL domain-containing protein [Phycisphaerae bacterium]